MEKIKKIIKKYFPRDSDKKKFFNILNCFTEPVLLTDLCGNILYSNNYVNELFKYKTLVNLNVDMLIPDNIKDKHSIYIKNIHKSNINSSMEKRNVTGKRNDMSTIELLIKLNLIKLDDKDYIFIIVNRNTQIIKFDTFFNSSSDLFAVTKDTTFLHLNNSFYKFFDDPDIYNKTFLEYIHPDDIQETINEINKLNYENNTVSFTNRYLRKGNVYRTMSWKATNIDGLIYSIARDITENELIATALSLSVDGISRIDKDGLYIYTNDAYSNICGYKSNELLGKHWNITVHENEIDKMNKLYLKMKETGKSEDDIIGIKKNGDIFYKRITMIYVNEIHFCFIKDISIEYLQNTKIIKLQHLLLESEKLAKIGSWTWNINTNELIWTNGLKNIYGLDKNETVTFDKYMEINHPDDREFIISTVNKSIKNKSNYTFTHRLIINNKIKYLYAKGQYIKDNDEEFIIGCGQDITDNKKTEIDLINARDIAEQASKMKSLFVANMSHEIRTPINGIVGMATLLKETVLNTQQRDFVEIIISSSGTLLSIINNVLDFAKIETGKVSIDKIDNVDIREIINDISKIYKQNLSKKDKNVSFTFSIDDDIPKSISIDSNKLTQVLTNLINNAIKFTEYGSVTLLLDHTIPDFLNFEIKDTGIGINKNILKTLFTPFEQGDQSITKMYGGTGLGLAICKNIISIMGGEINIFSIEKIGTAVKFSVPYTRSNSIKDISNETSYEYENSQKIIVIVEDNKINQIVLQKMLNKAGYTNIITYNDGLDCINNINSIKTRIGIIFMDIHMPKIDGYTATIQIRENNINVPIIACTANAMSGEREKCKQQGMDDFLLKPYQYNTLVNLTSKYFNN